MKKCLAGLVAAMFSINAAHAAAPASAAGRCFKPADIEAEQAILFQTELMVIAEACRVPSYVNFTQRNRVAVIAYQKQMIDHFRRAGDRNATAAFDTYQTRLANQSALRNGQTPLPTLCSQAKEFLVVGNELDGDGFRRYAAARAATNQPYYRVCRG
jgi:hypothetical protein